MKIELWEHLTIPTPARHLSGTFGGTTKCIIAATEVCILSVLSEMSNNTNVFLSLVYKALVISTKYNSLIDSLIR